EQHVAARAHGGLEVELAALRIPQEQGPVARAQQLGDLGEDHVHHLADVEGRGERLADLVEHRELVDGALELAKQVAGLHPTSLTSARVNLLSSLTVAQRLLQRHTCASSSAPDRRAGARCSRASVCASTSRSRASASRASGASASTLIPSGSPGKRLRRDWNRGANGAGRDPPWPSP